jgi:uncharacterized repeat protein (TIGR03803 family)
VLPLLGRAPMAVTGLFRCLALGAAMLAPVVAKAETLQTLYMFKGSPDGRFPFGGVAFDNSGNLYGTTLYNGTTCGGSGCGAVFKLAPPSSGKAEWTETLYPFTGSPQGANPYDGLAYMNGAFYGTTAYGGYANSTNCMGGCGTVFEFDPATQKLTTLYTFNGTTDVGGPYVGLAFDTKGNLYGTTEGGDNANNSNGGAVFELTPSTNGSTPWSYSTLHTFNETTDNADGGISSRLVLDKNGNIYATTKYGGNSNCSCGTVYRLDAGTWKLTTLHTFTGGADGGSPNGLAIYYLGTGSFTLYGTTNKGGGAGNAGTVFALDPETQALTTLHAFTGGADGGEPDGLIVDAAGNLYGATLFGGAAGRFDGATSIGGIASGCAFSWRLRRRVQTDAAGGGPDGMDRDRATRIYRRRRWRRPSARCVRHEGSALRNNRLRR